MEQFRRRLAEYDGIDKVRLRENMAVFLRAIVPVAEEAGIRLAVHPTIRRGRSSACRASFPP